MHKRFAQRDGDCVADTPAGRLVLSYFRTHPIVRTQEISYWLMEHDIHPCRQARCCLACGVKGTWCTWEASGPEDTACPYRTSWAQTALVGSREAW